MITWILFYCNWWASPREIEVLKSVNKLFFWSKNWKKWANEVYFVYFFIYFLFFKWYLNLGKYIKLNFLIKDQKFLAFSQNWNSVNAKKHKCCFFFLVGGSAYYSTQVTLIGRPRRAKSEQELLAAFSPLGKLIVMH